MLPIRLAPLVALLGAAAQPQLLLQTCKDGSPEQLFSHSQDVNNHLVHIASGMCVQMESGCCSGEEVRAGDVLQLQTCGKYFQSQMFGLPNASFSAAPNALAVLSSEGEPNVETVSGQLVIDAGGALYPGALVQVHTYDAVASPFLLNGTAASAQLRSAAAPSLCLSVTGPIAAKDPPAALAPCRSAQVPGDYFSSQLFFPSRGALRTSRGQCLTADRAWGTATGLPGQIRLVGASCAAPGADGSVTPAQSIVLTGDGELSAAGVAPAGLVADAGAGAWWGAPVSRWGGGRLGTACHVLSPAPLPPPPLPGRPLPDAWRADSRLLLRALARQRQLGRAAARGDGPVPRRQRRPVGPRLPRAGRARPALLQRVAATGRACCGRRLAPHARGGDPLHWCRPLQRAVRGCWGGEEGLQQAPQPPLLRRAAAQPSLRPSRASTCPCARPSSRWGGEVGRGGEEGRASTCPRGYP